MPIYAEVLEVVARHIPAVRAAGPDFKLSRFVRVLDDALALLPDGPKFEQELRAVLDR